MSPAVATMVMVGQGGVVGVGVVAEGVGIDVVAGGLAWVSPWVVGGGVVLGIVGVRVVVGFVGVGIVGVTELKRGVSRGRCVNRTRGTGGFMVAAVAVAALVAGCAAPGGPNATDPPGFVGPGAVVLSASVSFAPPVQLTGDIGGFEPSIRAAADGNLYAAAAKVTRPNAGTRLADWAWFSNDGGATWSDLPMGPAGIGALMAGIEGDLAVDGHGRVYYADTYAGDLTLHRWSARDSGASGAEPRWDWSRPFVPTVSLIDDRPFMAAHGDGIAYLMLNNGWDVPGWQNAAHDPTNLNEEEIGPWWLFASQDAGLTWSLGWAFAGENWCAPAASPTDDRAVVVACARGNGPGAQLTMYRSDDRGQSFASVWSTNFTNGVGYLNPWSAMDDAGWTYAAWLDDRVEWSGLQTVVWAGETPGRIVLARSPDGADWERLDVTPFAGRFGMSHVSAAPPGGPAGVVAITFHATTDLTPDAQTEWYGYALVTPDARADQPDWHLALLDERPTAVGPMPPRDFFQNAVGIDGRVHVILQHERELKQTERPNGNGVPADVLYVGQRAGPNVAS